MICSIIEKLSYWKGEKDIDGQTGTDLGSLSLDSGGRSSPVGKRLTRTANSVPTGSDRNGAKWWPARVGCADCGDCAGDGLGWCNSSASNGSVHWRNTYYDFCDCNCVAHNKTRVLQTQTATHNQRRGPKQTTTSLLEMTYQSGIARGRSETESNSELVISKLLAKLDQSCDSNGVQQTLTIR